MIERKSYLRKTHRRPAVKLTELATAERWLGRQETRLRVTLEGRLTIPEAFVDAKTTEFMRDDLAAVLTLRRLVTRLIQIEGIGSVEQLGS